MLFTVNLLPASMRKTGAAFDQAKGLVQLVENLRRMLPADDQATVDAAAVLGVGSPRR